MEAAMTDISASITWHWRENKHRQIYLVAVKVNSCPSKIAKPSGPSMSKSRTGWTVRSTLLRLGAFLEVRMCIFKRKARLKQTGDGFCDFVSVWGMNQQENNSSELLPQYIFCHGNSMLGFTQMFPTVSAHWDISKELATDVTLTTKGGV